MEKTNILKLCQSSYFSACICFGKPYFLNSGMVSKFGFCQLKLSLSSFGGDDMIFKTVVFVDG